MNTEQIRSILNFVMKKSYPEIDAEIYISIEPDTSYYHVTDKKIINVYFDLSPEHYDLYIGDGVDKKKWDKIRDLIRDIAKTLPISGKVAFYYGRHEE